MEAATIFAPSDAAFAKLPEGILESLTEGQKRAIVSRHVIGGKKMFWLRKELQIIMNKLSTYKYQIWLGLL